MHLMHLIPAICGADCHTVRVVMFNVLFIQETHLSLNNTGLQEQKSATHLA